jgi:hypothetical protein
LWHTAISIKVVPSKGEKSNMSAEGLLGIPKKSINLLAISNKPFSFVFDFTALFVDNLN